MITLTKGSLYAGATAVAALSVFGYWRSKRVRTPASTLAGAAPTPAQSLTLDAARAAAESKVPGWAGAGDALLAKPLSGGMSNALFLVRHSSPPPGCLTAVLVRGFGEGMSELINRDDEHAVFEQMAAAGLGPKLIAVLDGGGGRIEEFLTGRTLTRDDFAAPDLSSPVLTAVLTSLAALHKTKVALPSGPTSGTPRARLYLERWLALAVQVLDSRPLDGGFAFSQAWLAEQVRLVLADWAAMSPPVVFSHNDTQYGNVLLDDATGRATWIDYEYAGENYAGYDIGNLFCEHTFVYTAAVAPGFLWRPEDYPSDAKQRALCAAYLQAASRSASPDAVEALVREAQLGAMTSHLAWALWAIFKADTARSPGQGFDYAAYASVRLLALRGERDRWSRREPTRQ